MVTESKRPIGSHNDRTTGMVWLAREVDEQPRADSNYASEAAKWCDHLQPQIELFRVGTPVSVLGPPKALTVVGATSKRET